MILLLLAGSQCTSFATRNRTWAVLGCATTSTPSLGRATRASLTTPSKVSSLSGFHLLLVDIFRHVLDDRVNHALLDLVHLVLVDLVYHVLLDLLHAVPLDPQHGLRVVQQERLAMRAERDHWTRLEEGKPLPSKSVFHKFVGFFPKRISHI